jgi:hypothetical protein
VNAAGRRKELRAVKRRFPIGTLVTTTSPASHVYRVVGEPAEAWHHCMLVKRVARGYKAQLVRPNHLIPATEAQIVAAMAEALEP